MSRILSILLALIVLVGSFLVIRYAKDSYKVLPINEKNPLLAQSSNFEEWREFSHPDGLFKALLPSLPQHVTDKISDPITKEPRKYDIFAAADEHGTAYVINIITFPNKMETKDIENAMLSVVNDMLIRNKENKLTMTKMGKLRNLRSLDFTLENGEVTIAGKVIFHDNTLYVLSMVDKTNAFKTKEFDFFVNSFDINDSNKKLPDSSQILKKQ